MYTTSEVAKLFRVDPKSVKRWVAVGKLKAIKTPGGHYRFEEEHIDNKLKETS